MKIVALCGLLGYGYNEKSLELAFSEKVDYVGVDAGSTDPGPYYLGSGTSFTDRNAVKRDRGFRRKTFDIPSNPHQLEELLLVVLL